MATLNDLEQRMLDLEREDWSTSPGGKELAIRERLGLRVMRYYQLLNRLITTEAALAYDPITVNRLLRIRDRRHEAREKARA
ncbi:DUF3263 domain-containing protein [Mycolicibacterium peregrinum]|uniref:DUF3263 domain-containing protein n=1 Tax=Mycolicibacterium peregrinum TaxID=43304 RepID=A0A4Z0HKS6_MYCPR|nr:DUF3263 domain-containing protein [Mycolicibacterium peregrinum]TGB37905.1 DUF3263 domain-containing protein [Mycolicibacterium peregrinum]TGB38076.1 DUF3263 domain-containing protein [Mycolicibacterium peregrinum]